MTWNGFDPWYVYEIVDPRNGKVFYIGKTGTPKARFSAHRRDPGSAAYLRIQDISDAGLMAVMNVIGEFKSEQEALDYEQYLIDRTPGLVNRTGAYGTCGTPPTQPFTRPVVGVEDLEYEHPAELLPVEKRAQRLYEVAGGDVPIEHIQRVLELLESLSHEESEYTYTTDE